VPHFWITLQSNPKSPKQIDRETRFAVDEQDGARLLGDAAFFHPDKPGLGYATVQCTDEQIARIAEQLHCKHERVFTSEEPEADDLWGGGYDGAGNSDDARE
jgi:hypothetical protein